MESSIQTSEPISKKTKSFLERMEGHLIKWILGGVGAVILTYIGFYYSTIFTQKDHEKRITTTEVKVDSISKIVLLSTVEPQVISEKIKALKTIIQNMKEQQEKRDERFEKRLDRNDDRQDRIYDAVNELAKRVK